MKKCDTIKPSVLSREACMDRPDIGFHEWCESLIFKGGVSLKRHHEPGGRHQETIPLHVEGTICRGCIHTRHCELLRTVVSLAERRCEVHLNRCGRRETEAHAQLKLI